MIQPPISTTAGTTSVAQTPGRATQSAKIYRPSKAVALQFVKRIAALFVRLAAAVLTAPCDVSPAT